jgi:hypothetical protein
MNRFVWIGLVGLLLIVGCKNKKRLAATPPAVSSEYQERAALIAALDSACCKMEGMEMKTSLKFEQEKQKLNLKAIFRINTDSAIWASVSFSGLPVLNALFTQDSIKFLTKQPRKLYFLGTYNDINKQFGVSITYAFLQDFLYARPLELINSEKTSFKEKNGYYEFKNAAPSAIIEMKELNKLYKFSKTDLTYRYFEAKSEKDTIDLKITYDNYSALDNCFFPNLIQLISEKAEKQTKLTIDVNKINTGKQTDMPFKYTDNYELFQFGK